MEEIIVTENGLKELEQKLLFLKTEKRSEIAKNIGVAREFGDLSENAEYTAAKEEQSQLEMQIEDLEYKIANAKVIDEKLIDNKKVNIGSYVKVFDEEFDETMFYHIVGSTESDPTKGQISNMSPVGKALIGKQKNDKAIVETPNGELTLKILDIDRTPFKN